MGKISASNIGWKNEDDNKIYKLMHELGYTGIEIAPTRIIENCPYECVEMAFDWKSNLGFEVPSMQSIWYGKSGNIFSSESERNLLLEYTMQAIRWAHAIECRNLVFGCPRNRNIREDIDYKDAYIIAKDFFGRLAEYATDMGVVIGLEANPPIYNTNFINTTIEAVDFIRDVGMPGLRLNLDLGTMIECDESIDILEDRLEFISHIHVSEPGLQAIKERDMHKSIANILKEGGYGGYVSLEMSNACGLDSLEKSLRYVAEVFG